MFCNCMYSQLTTMYNSSSVLFKDNVQKTVTCPYIILCCIAEY